MCFNCGDNSLTLFSGPQGAQGVCICGQVEYITIRLGAETVGQPESNFQPIPSITYTIPADTTGTYELFFTANAVFKAVGLLRINAYLNGVLISAENQKEVKFDFLGADEEATVNITFLISDVLATSGDIITLRGSSTDNINIYPNFATAKFTKVS